MKKMLLIGVGFSLVMGATTPKAPSTKSENNLSTASQMSCLLLKVYDQCHQISAKRKIVGNKFECVQAGITVEGAVKAQFGNREGIKGKEEALDRFAKLVGAACYAGCMEKSKFKEQLQQECPLK
jgi:hypothetical protein